MKITTSSKVASSGLLATLLLSACAPNPTVLQDRVYSTYPQQPSVPVAPAPKPPPPVSHTIPLPKERAPTVEQRPVVKQPIPETSSSSVIDVTPSNTDKRPSWDSKPSWESMQADAAKTDSTKQDVNASVIDAKPSKSYPTSPAVQALMKQADGEIASNKLDAAAATLERALRIESDNPDVWAKLSRINAMQGHQDQANSMASKAQAYRELLN